MKTIEIGKYKHYKGSFYEVKGCATHSETLETMVIYKQLYGEESMWVRPISMFYENVEINGRLLPRFEKIDD